MRILFAEDDHQLADSLARGLREQSYAVDTVDNGDRAIELATTRDYDALILDVLMPGRNGLEVCRAVRGKGNPVPILMLTALDAVDHKITGLDAGADDYLAKPFDFGELVARLRALTRRRGEVLASNLVVGDLVIDSLKRTARRGRRQIALTSKEFAFLYYLARNADRIVSRAELMAHVWDDNRTTYSNIIDVYASRLRRKIDDGERVPLFTTHRGAGYMLSAENAAKRKH